jgi:hypothetical protein
MRVPRGWVTLNRGRETEPVATVELEPQESASVLKSYVTEVPITWPFLDARPDSLLETFEWEAPRHSVFRMVGEME